MSEKMSSGSSSASSAVHQVAQGYDVTGSALRTIDEGTKSYGSIIDYLQHNPLQATLIYTATSVLVGLLIGNIQRRKSRAINIKERSFNAMISIDFHVLINTVADNFEQTHRMQINSQARKALIDPALPHREQVERELETGKVTVSYLQNCVLLILKNAHDIALTQGHNQIDAAIVKKSMDRECPYLGWC